MISRNYVCCVLTLSVCLLGPGPVSMWGWMRPVCAEQEAPASTTKDGDRVEDNDGEGHDSMTAEEQQEYYELLKLFVDTLDQVDRNYTKRVSRRELMEAAIQGILSKLDNYSNYIAPEDLAEFQKDVTSEFGGIGIQIGMQREQLGRGRERERLTIISPLVGTPAYRAGLMAGDRIVRINGKTTNGMTINEAVKLLKGTAGTEVTLTVVHRGRGERETVTLQREIVRIETVLGDRRKEDDSWQFLYDQEEKIGYVRVTAFSYHTATDLQHALRELQDQGMRALLLDLRTNPGGLLSSALSVSDLFLRDGLIVTTEGRNVRKQSWSATEQGTFDGFPIAVLVNRYSASASEIVAACLQDHKCAVVVGERTFGKGSVQQVVDLEAGRSALKLTTGSYQRPSGKNIHRFPDSSEDDDWGVRPDPGLEVRFNASEFEQWFLAQRKRGIIRPRNPPSRDGDAANQEDSPPTETEDTASETAQPKFVDRQLQKALEYLKQQLAEVENE